MADDGIRRSGEAFGITILTHDSDLPLLPGLVGDLLDRREEIFKDAASAEVDLRAHLHAGDEAQLPALTFEVAAAEVNQRAVGCFLDGLDGRIARLRFFVSIGADSFDHVIRFSQILLVWSLDQSFGVVASPVAALGAGDCGIFGDPAARSGGMRARIR